MCGAHKYGKTRLVWISMTSNIRPDSINTNYPVAGSDNESQGFRDNFEAMRVQLAVAASEISNLQNTTLRLSGPVQSNKVVLTSDPNGTLVVTRFQNSDLENSITFPGTGAIRVPVGLTAQRPASAPLAPSTGMIRFNTDYNKLEYYNGTAWYLLSDSSPGQITQNEGLLNAVALVIYNLPFIRAQVNAWVQANYPLGYSLTPTQLQKCSRDLTTILFAVMNDTLLGSTYNSVAAGNAYWNGVLSVLVYNTPEQKQLTVDALNYALSLVQKIVANIAIVPSFPGVVPPSQVVIPSFSGGIVAYAPIASNLAIVNNIILNGPSTEYANVVPTSTGNFSAQTLVYLNLDFLSQEVVGYINNQFPAPFSYDQAKCARDVQLIAACVMSDVLSGINLNSYLAGNKYYVSGKTVIPGQVVVTVAALQHLKSLMNAVITNTAAAPVYSLVPQTFDLAYTDGGLWYNDIVARIDLIINILQTGPQPIPAPSGGPAGPVGATGPTGPAGTGSGPGGTPGGPTQAVQFNNGGVFDGSADLKWDGSKLIASKLAVDQVQIDNDVITNSLATGILNLNAKGQVNTLNINNPGSGYTSVPAITIDPPPPGGVQAVAEAIMGAVPLVVPWDRGTSYVPGDTLTVQGGVFSAPTLLQVETARIKSVLVDPNNEGRGYKPNDVLTVAGGDGPASATIIITRVKLIEPQIIAQGVGYISGEEITVFGGSGTAATALITADPIQIAGKSDTSNIVVNPAIKTYTIPFVIDPLDYNGVTVTLNNTIILGNPYSFAPNGLQTDITFLPAFLLQPGDVIGVFYNSFSGDGIETNFDLSRAILPADYFDLYVTIDNVKQTLGTNYTISQPASVTRLTFTTAPGIGQVISIILGGRVTDITINNSGSYRELPNIVANPAVGGSGRGLLVEYETAAKFSPVESTCQLQNQGPYYVLPPLNNNKPTGGSGYGVQFNMLSEINTLIITDPGYYTFLPTLLNNPVTGGSGTGARVNLSYGLISAIVNSSGSGYTNTPQAIVQPSPSGNTARVTPIMTGARVSVGDLVVTGVAKGTSPAVTNVIWVTKDGDDNNDGLAEDRAKRTVKAAAAIAKPFTTIFVRSGNYYEDNPIYLPERVSVIGDNLRRVNLYYNNPTKDFFWVNNACYIAGVSFRGGKEPGFAITYPPLAGDPDLPPGVPGGAGVISTSPYVQNCTCFNETGGGMKVDGNLAKGLKSMVLDAFTQYNQGGPGIYITNQGYAQLVSIFTICCTIGTWVENGATCSISNSNTSFGDIGILADGISPYLYGGRIKAGTGRFRVDTIDIKNIIQRPFVGLVATVGPEFSYVSEIRVIDQGQGYTSTPLVLLDPPIGYARERAVFTADVIGGGITALNKISGGSGYTGGAFATIFDPSGTGAIIGAVIYSCRSDISGGVTILNGGRGYQVNDVITISGGTFPNLQVSTPVLLQVAAVGLGGAVAGVFVIDEGEYTELPIVSGAATTSSGVGTGFSCSINFGINSITLASSGTGYTTPTVTISGGGGITAKGRAEYDGNTGTIREVTLISQGGGYIAQPIVVIEGGGGSGTGDTGATAITEVTNGVVTNVRITNPGSNFVLDPTVRFSGGGGAGAKAGQIWYQAVRVSVNKVVTTTGNTYFNGGQGYQINDLLEVVGGEGTARTRVRVVAVTSNGSTSGIVTRVALDTAGKYSKMPTLNGVQTTYVLSGSGTGCLLDLSMGLAAIDLASGGNSYSAGPRVRFQGGDAESFSFLTAKAAVSPIDTPNTLLALDYARDWAYNLIDNNPLPPAGYMGAPYQVTEVPVIDPALPNGIDATSAVTAFFTNTSQIINYGTSMSPYDNASSLLLLNKAFLQAEVLAYVNWQYPGFFNALALGNPVEEARLQALCSRDVGHIVDALAIDCGTGGFVRSIRAGQAYWNGVVSKIPGQTVETIDAINYILAWGLNLINNNPAPPGAYPGAPFQTAVTASINPVLINGSYASANLTAAVNVITNLISNGLPFTGYNSASALLKANYAFLQAEVTAYANTLVAMNNNEKADFAKLVGQVIDSVSGDIIGAGGTPAIAEAVLYPKYYTVSSATPLVINGGDVVPPALATSLSFRSGQRYWDGAVSLIPGQAVQTIQAINFAKTLSQSIVQNIAVVPLQTNVAQVTSGSLSGGAATLNGVTAFFDHVSTFINDGLTTANTRYSHAGQLLQANRSFLQAEIGAWVSITYPGFLTPAQLTLCERDVGLIVDGMTIDATKGGVIEALKSGRNYWNGVTSLIAGQESQTIGALTQLRALVADVITNTAIAPLQGVVPQVVNPALNFGSYSAQNLEACFDVLISTINPVYGPKNQRWNNASQLLRLNKQFIQAEVTQFVLNSFGPGFLTADQLSLCTRDAGFIVDSVAADLVGAGGSLLSDTVENETTVTLEEVTDYAPLDDEVVNFYQVSVASASSHTFEYVGAGTDINTCLPQLGGVPIQENEVVMRRGGRIYYTSTDHKGDFRIGEGLVINQNTGTLSGRVFAKSLFGLVTPFILSIESSG